MFRRIRKRFFPSNEDIKSDIEKIKKQKIDYKIYLDLLIDRNKEKKELQKIKDSLKDQ